MVSRYLGSNILKYLTNQSPAYLPKYLVGTLSYTIVNMVCLVPDGHYTDDTLNQ
jgi:hypothetical protein